MTNRKAENRRKRELLRFNEDLQSFERNQFSEEEDIRFLQECLNRGLQNYLGERISRMCRVYVLKGCCN